MTIWKPLTLAVLLTACSADLYYTEMTPVHYEYAEMLCAENGGIKNAVGETQSNTGRMRVWVRCQNDAHFSWKYFGPTGDPKQ